MNRLSTEKRILIVSMLCEGMSIRGVSRAADVSKTTVLKLLADLGTACQEHHDRMVRGLVCPRIEIDEVWTFSRCKDKNIPRFKHNDENYGDIWCFVAHAPDSKLVPCWRVGKRNFQTAAGFMHDLARRVPGRVQITTDGLRFYPDAVDSAFRNRVDYATLTKLYGKERRPTMGPEARYSPATITGIRRDVLYGDPEPDLISTSGIERQFLTLRQNNKRYSRLTLAFTKKVENLKHSLAINWTYYNWVKVHKSLRRSPAMAAGLADGLWSVADMVALLEKP